jgi:hypothetical protein
MVSPGGGRAGAGAAAVAPPTRKRLLSREELSDIEYLFDRLSREQQEQDPASRVPASPANSPLPLPILPAEPAGAARPAGVLPPPPPSVGFAQLKFALRAFGLPVRKGDVVALLQRHGYVPGGGGEDDDAAAATPAADNAAAAAATVRLSRPAFRELVGHALRDGLPGGRQADMARSFALLDRGGKGRVTREDVATAAAGALGREGAAALGGERGLSDMLALFARQGGGAERGVTLEEFVAGMSAVSLGRAGVGRG